MGTARFYCNLLQKKTALFLSSMKFMNRGIKCAFLYINLKMEVDLKGD